MWLLSTLIILLIFLIILVIISTSMKIGLIITNRHNYDSKLLIIPSILIMLLWLVALFTFYIIFKDTFSNGFEDMLLTLVMTPSAIENKSNILVGGSLILFITVLLQSFTYYAINIDYGKAWGYVRFKIKQILNIKPKEGKTSNMMPKEERFDVPFSTALITSILTFIITISLIFGLYKLGTKLSQKVMSRI